MYPPAFEGAMRQRILHFLRTVFTLVVFGAGAVTLAFFVVSRTDELAEDRLLPGGEKLPPPEPFWSRFGRWGHTVVGSGFADFGQSNKVVVKQVLAGRLPVTVTVGAVSWLLVWGGGLGLATALATRFRAWATIHQKVVYPMVHAAPALVVVILFYLILLHFNPTSSRPVRMAAGVAALVTLLLPTATALWYNGMVRVLASEYVRVLRARGLSPASLWLRHVLPNVVVSSGILTQAVFSLAGLVVGSAFVEGVFRLGGVAEILIEGARHGHAELCAFATLMYFAVTAFGVLATELVVLVLDPAGEVARAQSEAL
jgi:ABC-type dipeptide/oligopeptide/nickel transport system permease component